MHASARILAFTFGVSLGVGLLFGTIPAWRGSRLSLNGILKGAAGGFGRRGRISVAGIFVVAQVALSLLLLVVAGLFVHSFDKLTKVDLGFDHDHLLQFGMRPAADGYKDVAIAQLYAKLSDRLQLIPGVRGVSFAFGGPFSGGGFHDPIAIDAYAPALGQTMDANFDLVGPGYFSTAGIPIVLGREIESRDESSGQRVGVISQTMAHYYFGNTNPLGRRIRNMGGRAHGGDFIVVGVAGDARYGSAKEEPARRFYVPFDRPFEEGGTRNANFLVRVDGDPAALAAVVASSVREIAPGLKSMEEPWPMNRIVAGSLSVDRLLTKLSGCFGGLAAILASIGIYGLLSYSVARRTREIGIRMALGAQQANVLWLILRDSLLLVLIGVGIGVPASIGAGKLVSSLVFGLGLVDPPVLAITVLLMFAVAAVAGY